MNKSVLRRVLAVLAASSAVALLGAGCATVDKQTSASKGETTDGVSPAEDEGAVASARDEQRGCFWNWRLRRWVCPRGGWGGGWGGGGGGGGGCVGLQDGYYCGGDMVQGDPNTLYNCVNGALYVFRQCDFGCQTEAYGTADHCN